LHGSDNARLTSAAEDDEMTQKSANRNVTSIDSVEIARGNAIIASLSRNYTFMKSRSKSFIKDPLAAAAVYELSMPAEMRAFYMAYVANLKKSLISEKVAIQTAKENMRNAIDQYGGGPINRTWRAIMSGRKDLSGTNKRMFTPKKIDDFTRRRHRPSAPIPISRIIRSSD
jgi:hypothetical protein